MKNLLKNIWPFAAKEAPVPVTRINRVTAVRSYSGAAFTRLTADWQATGASQDSETLLALRTLRFRSRQLVRDNHTAKNALRVISTNVVGMGVNFQPSIKMQRGGGLDEKTNKAIKKAWARWGRAKNCDLAGKLDFPDMERLIMKSLVQDGEILIRKRKKAVGKSTVPFSLEILESDYLIDFRNAHADNGNEIRMGVEIDKDKRPVAYWLHPNHPGDYQMRSFTPSKYIRVPAEEIIHLFVPDRPGQTRGIPWIHAAMTKLRHMAGYDEAEVIAARASACIMGFLETPDGEYSDPDGAKDDQRNMDLEAGVTKVLASGEKFNGFAPQRPGGQYEPFMRSGTRDIGAAVGCSYESLSKDYSQSNYSSSRLALLDDRDNWRVLQQWLISHFHQEVYEEWLQAAVLSATLNLPSFYSNPDIYDECEWKPRGWEWVDPLKEVTAAKVAVRAGFKTQADIIAQGGGDLEDLIEQRKREIELAKSAGIIFDSDAAVADGKGDIAKAQGSDPMLEDGTGSKPKPQDSEVTDSETDDINDDQ